MKKIILFLFSVSLLFAEEFVDYTSIFYKIYTEEQYVASSFLIDEKYAKDRYSPNKVFDERENTAWVVRTDHGGVGEYICFWISIDSGNGDFTALWVEHTVHRRRRYSGKNRQFVDSDIALETEFTKALCNCVFNHHHVHHL